MDDYSRKGRALHLEGIANAPVKVTVGFKCEGREKIRLAHEAHQSAMTLSEYVEYIVSLRHELNQPTVTEAMPENEQWNGTIHRLRQQLAIYEENEQLQSLLTTYLGKSVTLQDSKGKERNVIINHVSDIFHVMVSSFKTH